MVVSILFEFMSRIHTAFSLISLLILVASCATIKGNARGKAIDLEPETNAQIPFDTIQNLIIVEAEINGHKGRFLFDNGFTLSAVHPDFAQKAGIQFGQATMVNDINNKKSSLEETTLASITIGDFEFKKTGLWKIDTKKFFPCDNIDGVIGGSIINKANWKILYNDRVLEVSEQPYDVPQNAAVLNVDFNRGNSALTNVTIQEQEITCKIDIGMSAEMSIKEKYAQLFQGMEAINNYGIGSLSGSGLGNPENNYELSNRVVFAANDVQLTIGATLELDASQKYNGYIGVGYLRHYDVLLNSSEKQYVLTNPKIPVEVPESGYGVTIYMIEDTCRIIQKNGADKLLRDIPLMSIVTHIDDTPVSEFSGLCELRTYQRNKYREKSDMVIQLKDVETPITLRYREEKTVRINDHR